MKLRLEAHVGSDSPHTVGHLLVGKFGARSVTRDAVTGLHAEVESASARDANRELLSELRRVERKI